MFTRADYDRGVSDVGDLLELLHAASGRWQASLGQRTAQAVIFGEDAVRV
jgi:hypothetical protein